MNKHPGASCNDVMGQLWEYIDGELTPERTTLIKAHLERCQACFPQYDFHNAFMEFLGRQCHQAAPPGLRRKVFEMLLSDERRTAGQ
ncbi:MAG: mycothiol system anti-sigma-R factor [Gemmatimonadota bacterium]